MRKRNPDCGEGGVKRRLAVSGTLFERSLPVRLRCFLRSDQFMGYSLVLGCLGHPRNLGHNTQREGDLGGQSGDNIHIEEHRKPFECMAQRVAHIILTPLVLSRKG